MVTLARTWIFYNNRCDDVTLGLMMMATTRKKDVENGLTLSLLRVINVKIPLQPHKKYDITQYGELDFA